MRVEGWESLLTEHIEQARYRPFVWGEHDCSLDSADWIRKCTGVDLGSDWRGHYKTKAGATRAMRKRGFLKPADIAANCLSAVPVAFARRGDIVLHPNGALGICNGRASVFVAEDGLLEIPTLSCVRAWRVG